MANSSLIEYAGYLSLLAIAAKIGLCFTTWIYRRFIASCIDVTKCGGNWALVTGSTDGIGKAYAFALAKKGLNVVLVSRTPYKLQNVAAEIEEKYSGVKTKIIEVNFAKEDPSAYIPKIEDAIKDIEIGVLVNNVGMSYDHPNEFLNIDSSYVEEIINVNITSLNVMTRIVLPQMVERKNGAIINIASLSGVMASPMLSVYSGSKAYTDFFSMGLAKEYANCGITVQCILPGPVVSNMSKLKRASLSAPNPDAFVKSNLKRLGIDDRTAGFWFHDIMMFVTESLLPRNTMANICYSYGQTLKAKALRKKEKQK